jgi:hypothetical protein
MRLLLRKTRKVDEALRNYQVLLPLYSLVVHKKAILKILEKSEGVGSVIISKPLIEFSDQRHETNCRGVQRINKAENYKTHDLLMHFTIHCAPLKNF